MYAEIVHLIFDGIGLILLACVCYFIIYQIRKYNLEHWIVKTMNAANILFIEPGLSQEKKDWVVKFLEDNNLNKGVSDDVVDALILSTANELQMKNRMLDPKKTL